MSTHNLEHTGLRKPAHASAGGCLNAAQAATDNGASMIESFKSRRWMGRIAAAGVAVALAAGLAGCGGGDRDQPFKPTRMVVFGDEYSTVESGSSAQYTVNYKVIGESTFRCEKNVIWVHWVALHYGLPFPGCSGTSTTSYTYASSQAKVAQVTSQIDTFVSTYGFREGDVVTVLAGANDIKAAFEAYLVDGRLDLAQAATRAAGETLGNKISTITKGGAKVLVLTVPDLGPTPYGIAANGSATTGSDFLGIDCSTDPGSNKQKALSVLTACFNNGLRTKMPQDGTKAGLVLADQLIRLIVEKPSDYSVTNIVTPLCKSSTTFTPTNTCFIQFSDTLETAASTTWDQLNTTSTVDLNYWLWAGDIYLSPGGNAKLGSAAISRSQSNWE